MAQMISGDEVLTFGGMAGMGLGCVMQAVIKKDTGKFVPRWGRSKQRNLGEIVMPNTDGTHSSLTQTLGLLHKQTNAWVWDIKKGTRYFSAHVETYLGTIDTAFSTCVCTRNDQQHEGDAKLDTTSAGLYS